MDMTLRGLARRLELQVSPDTEEAARATIIRHVDELKVTIAQLLKRDGGVEQEKREAQRRALIDKS